SEGYFFFRVSLFNAQGTALYDSSKGEFGPDQQTAAINLPRAEAEEVLKKKVVFLVGESPIFAAKLAYVEIAFDLNGAAYILRTAIPFSQVEEFTAQFKVWFFAFCALALLFFGSVTWLIFHRINYPIRQIITAIKPYQ